MPRLPQSDTPPVKPIGESWVWVTSLGLSVGLIMIVGLLIMIVYNGLEVFWPKPVARIELSPDSETKIGSATTLGGAIVKTQEKRVTTLGPDGRPLPPEKEIQLFVGNKDLYGFSYKYVDAHDIRSTDYPAEVIVAERVEYGDAIFLPLSLTLPDGTAIPADTADFEKRLEALVDEGNERRERIRHLERDLIGEINRQMEAYRIRLRQLDDRPDAAPERARIDTAIATLQHQFEGLAAEARALRQQQEAARITYRTLDGREHTAPVSNIIRFHRPNQLGFFGKLGIFASHFWSFLSEEPREANTEGGIFPAIFGTFVMTMLMSIAVTPFGVLAAIYLREYARQGLFVRGVRIAVNNLAGVPSIVFGVFGLGFFVYLVGGSIDELFYSERLPTPTFGTGGILWASLTLALMTVPVVIVATEEALAAVSRGMREGSLACGASKWQTIQHIVLPASLPGILTGLILAMARGAGEVAPLMLVGVVKLAPTLPIDTVPPFIHLERKFMHLGFHIYDLGFQSPDSEAAKPMVFATTFLLILLVVVLNLGAILIRNYLRKRLQASTF